MTKQIFSYYLKRKGVKLYFIGKISNHSQSLQNFEEFFTQIWAMAILDPWLWPRIYVFPRIQNFLK